MNRQVDAMRARIKNLHFVGIGGSGMSGIAEVYLNMGYKVTGSDLKESAVVERLRGLGANVMIGHCEENVLDNDVDVVVISTAVNNDNPEVNAANKKLIPVVRRAEMLAELMRFSFGIAIAGTHGKTTTTSLVTSVLAEGDLDPTFVIGGLLNSAGANARLGTGQYLVAEADESDASFLYLKPMFSVVTNIDEDHMSTYDGSVERLHRTFMEFLHHLPFYGLAVMCIDDETIRELLPQVGRTVRTYGLADDAEVRATNVRPAGLGMDFTAHTPNHPEGFEVHLNLPGVHNVQNALAAIAIADELDVEPKDMVEALNSFQGIGRRFQVHGDVEVEAGTVTVVDDYGHHPREINATLSAAKAAYPDRRLVLVYQPHRYSRTEELFDDFVTELSAADTLVLCEVFAAGEAPKQNADSRAVAKALRARGQIEPVFVETPNDSIDVLKGMLADGDVILTMGAGDIGRLPAVLMTELPK